MTEIRILDEHALLTSLDEYRAVVAHKVAGLTRDQSLLHVMPSGVTLLGVLKHLIWVERKWFVQHLAGEDVELGDIDSSFQVQAHETPESIVREYGEVCARSRGIVAQYGFDELTATPHWYFGGVTVRWLIFHMIRETARHAGHMDILRELTDGQVGD